MGWDFHTDVRRRSRKLRRCVERGCKRGRPGPLGGIKPGEFYVRSVGTTDGDFWQVDLCERCVDLGAIPYYLHQLDRVQGAAHFEVPEPRGREIVDQLRSLLPGYAVPRYVREIPGKSSKWPL